jgi:DNA transformation protein
MAMKKKDRARDASFVAFVEEQLAALGGVRSRSMFGGYGLYARDVFFACVDDGRLYFRVDDSTRPRYVERGMGPFAPMADMVMKSYYEVPVDVIEDAGELVRWARDARAAAPKKKATGAVAAKAGKSAVVPKPAKASPKSRPAPRKKAGAKKAASARRKNPTAQKKRK